MARLLRSKAKKKNLLVQDPELLQQRREEVARVALDLFLKEGFHRTGIRDIARRAAISVGAVFTYFRDKEDLLFYLLSRGQLEGEKRLLEALRQKIEEAGRNGADPERMLGEILETFLRAVDELRPFILLAYQETKSLNAEARRALMARERNIQALLAEAIRYGIERGSFAPGEVELKAHSIMVLGHAWAVRRWAFVGLAENVEEYLRFLQPCVLNLLRGGSPKRTSALKKEKSKKEVLYDSPGSDWSCGD